MLNYLKQLPQVSAPFLGKALDLAIPTARTALNHMVKLGILDEVSGKKRNKVYVYQRYLNLLEEGAVPL